MKAIVSCRNLFKDEKGSAIVETTSAVVLLMLVFLSGIYFLMAYRTQIVMEMAAKEGARQSQISNSITNAQKELKLGNISGVSVSTTGKRVVVSKNLQINIPIVGDYLFNLKASAEFRKENKILYYK